MRFVDIRSLARWRGVSTSAASRKVTAISSVKLCRSQNIEESGEYQPPTIPLTNMTALIVVNSKKNSYSGNCRYSTQASTKYVVENPAARASTAWTIQRAPLRRLDNAQP